MRRGLNNLGWGQCAFCVIEQIEQTLYDFSSVNTDVFFQNFGKMAVSEMVNCRSIVIVSFGFGPFMHNWSISHISHSIPWSSTPSNSHMCGMDE